MATSEERKGTDIPPEAEDDEVEPGRSAPIDEDVEGELNAALPERPDQEQDPARESS
jgi:hypothetical protein